MGAAGSLAQSDKPSLTDLSLEVAALQTLYEFRMTPAQMEALRKLAPKSSPRDPGKGSDKLRQALTDYRAALLKPDSEDRINQLKESLDALREAEKASLDDDVDITDAARRRTPEVLRSLSVKQVSAYLNEYDVPDPLERLLEALDKVSTLKDADWRELSEEIVDEVSWLMAGLDVRKGKLVGDKVEQFLAQVRNLKDKDFKSKRPDLERAARLFANQVPPTAVLHNYAERAVAELLSNPQLATALDARLKK